jgi:hypothetical protein
MGIQLAVRGLIRVIERDGVRRLFEHFHSSKSVDIAALSG